MSVSKKIGFFNFLSYIQSFHVHACQFSPSLVNYCTFAINLNSFFLLVEANLSGRVAQEEQDEVTRPRFFVKIYI